MSTYRVVTDDGLFLSGSHASWPLAYAHVQAAERAAYKKVRWLKDEVVKDEARAITLRDAHIEKEEGTS